MAKIISITLCLFLIVSITGCSQKNEISDTFEKKAKATSEHTPVQSAIQDKEAQQEGNTPESIENQEQLEKPSTEPEQQVQQQPVQNQSETAETASTKEDSIQVVAQPESIPVLVNKQFKLPDGYTPNDLIYTTIPFVFKEMTEKRKLRREAAGAIAKLFADAKQQGINLLGVSGYRSHATQVSLFNYYVKKDGIEKARTYSALPGTSEHQTGLAIDLTSGDGKCPAQDCFGNTIEAKWLQDHAAEYGFIIRYPEGKTAITGYKYEPWHLRYVGPSIAVEIMSRGITLEEYFNAVPVAN